MNKAMSRQCPLCSHLLIETKAPDWDKDLHMYARFFYRCDKCCIDIVVDHGETIATDKNGKIVLSGK